MLDLTVEAYLQYMTQHAGSSLTQATQGQRHCKGATFSAIKAALPEIGSGASKTWFQVMSIKQPQ